jgi:hypothetical protein
VSWNSDVRVRLSENLLDFLLAGWTWKGSVLCFIQESSRELLCSSIEARMMTSFGQLWASYHGSQMCAAQCLLDINIYI